MASKAVVSVLPAVRAAATAQGAATQVVRQMNIQRDEWLEREFDSSPAIRITRIWIKLPIHPAGRLDPAVTSRLFDRAKPAFPFMLP
jgi:hypothetical protein